MSSTIDEIIQTCSKEYNLAVTAENTRKYVAFLQRQERIHPDYFKAGIDDNTKRVYVNLEADKLYIFSILIRETKITSDINTKEQSLIDERVKLHHLRLRGCDQYMWDELKLYKVHNRRRDKAKSINALPNLPNYREIIDEVGQDEEVLKVWNSEIISYFTHVASPRTRKPYLGTKKSKT